MGPGNPARASQKGLGSRVEEMTKDSWVSPENETRAMGETAGEVWQPLGNLGNWGQGGPPLPGLVGGVYRESNPWAELEGWKAHLHEEQGVGKGEYAA